MLKIIKNIKSEEAQASVEFAIVAAAFLIIVVVLSLFWNLGDDGVLVEHALKSASHHLKEAAIGIVGDVFSY